MRKAYAAPAFVETRHIHADHLLELEASGVDLLTAGLAGVSSEVHETAYDLGIRSGSDLAGLLFRYWEPKVQGFSGRFARLKPRIQLEGRKYLQRSSPIFSVKEGRHRVSSVRRWLPEFCPPSSLGFDRVA
jgi:hypothetical protein